MTKAWKIAAAAVAGVIVLALVLPFFINVDKHRGAIQSQLEKRLHRKVTLGVIGLRLIPLSIRVADVSIAEDPGFASQAPFLTAKHIDVHVGLLALLRERVAIDSLRLRSPSVELIRNANGQWNYASLGGSGGGSGGDSLDLANLEMDNGRVALTDLQAHKPRAVYDHIDVKLRDFGRGNRFALDLAVHLPGNGKQLLSAQGTGGPWQAQGLASDFQGKIKLQEASLSSLLAFLNAGESNTLDFVASGQSELEQHGGVLGAQGNFTLARLRAHGTDVGAPASVDYEAKFDRGTELLKIESLKAKLGGFAITSSGSANLKQSPPALDLQVDTNDASLAELARLGGADVHDVHVEGRLTARVHAQGPADRPVLTGSGSLQNVSLTLASFTKPITIGNANLRFEQNGMRMNNLNVSVGGSSLNGTLSLQNLAQPQAKFTADINQVNVNEWKQMVKSSGPGTSKGTPASLPLANVTGSGTVSIGKLIYDNLTLTQLRANCTLDHGLIRLEPVTASLYGGQETGSITVDLRPEQPTYAVRMQMERVDANQLLSAMTSVKQLSGLLAANADTSFTSRPGEDIARTLNGKVNFKVINGKLAGVNLLNEVATVGRFLGYAPRGDAFTNIVQLTGNFFLQNGVAHTDDLKLQFDSGALTATGTVGLADQTLNLHLMTVLHKQMSDLAGGSQIGGFMSTALANDKGELVMPLIATGTFANPHIAPDGQEFARLKMQSLLPSATGILGALGSGNAGGVQGVLDALQGKKSAPGKGQTDPAGGLLDLFKKQK